MRVLVTGGAGYVGTVLTPALIDAGHAVSVLDTFWFGDFLLDPRVRKFTGDMRDQTLVRDALAGVDAVVHLACLSNDPTSDLDPALTREINLDAVVNVMRLAKQAGVGRFLFASSASVYGVREEREITENMELKPITLYSRYKAEAESALFELCSRDFVGTAVRNSTVCGSSPRMRLDTILNSFVRAALFDGRITVEGGQQLRPLLAMSDIVDLYLLLLTIDPARINGQAFNISAQNHKVLDVAKMVQRVIPCDLVFMDWTDPRSYHVNTDKAQKVLGFRAQRSLESTIGELRQAFESPSFDAADLCYYNLRKLKQLVTGGKLAPWSTTVRV